MRSKYKDPEISQVYENPKLQTRRQQESMLSTVTCMIRNNETDILEKILGHLPRTTQVQNNNFCNQVQS